MGHGLPLQDKGLTYWTAGDLNRHVEWFDELYY